MSRPLGETGARAGAHPLATPGSPGRRPAGELVSGRRAVSDAAEPVSCAAPHRPETPAAVERIAVLADTDSTHTRVRAGFDDLVVRYRTEDQLVSR